MGVSAATRDIKLYKEHAPKNMAYDNAQKKYFLTNSFKPLFNHDAKRTLVKLAHQISDGFDAVGDIEFPVEQPSQLNVPDINVIAKLTQAMINGKAVSVIYTLLSSGSSARELVPHTIVDNGLRDKGSCHLFRHATATNMLRGGANIRHVQKMLGHRHITSTQIYTHITVDELSETYMKTHPAAKNTKNE